MLLKWWQSHITQISQNWATKKIMKSKELKNSFYFFHYLLELDMESGKKKFIRNFGTGKAKKPLFPFLTKTIPNSENLPHTHTHTHTHTHIQ
jgi:hypothetical protein